MSINSKYSENMVALSIFEFLSNYIESNLIFFKSILLEYFNIYAPLS